MHTRMLGYGMLVLLLALGAAGARPTMPDYTPAKTWGPLSDSMRKVMKRHDIKGLSIAVVSGDILWAQGFGYADVEGKLPATAQTVYQAGGLAQLLTATAVLDLHEQGAIDIDRPLKAYLPQFDINTRYPDAPAITPRQMLSHHAGLPCVWLKGLWGKPPTPFTSYATVLQHEYTIAPPNTRYSYSEIGYGLLGHMVQQVTEKEFTDYMEDHLFRPLGMRRSSFIRRRDIAALLAQGYQGDQPQDEPPAGNLPACNLYTNAEDMGRFVQMILQDGKSGGRQILRPALVAEMLRAQHPNLALDFDQQVGLGWELADVQPSINYDGRSAELAGDTFLYHSYVLLLPEANVGAVVLSNSSTAAGAMRDLAIEGVRAGLEVKTHGGMWFPSKRPAPAEAATLDTAAVQPYAGFYSLQGQLMSLAVKGNHLYATINKLPLELAPRTDDRYTVRARFLGLPWTFDILRGTSLNFASVAGQKVLVAEQRGKRVAAAVKITPEPVPASWQGRLGVYAQTNPDVGSEVTLKYLALETRDGFLVAHASTSPGGEVLVPLDPVNDREAVTRGFGRGMGETVRVVRVDGEERLKFAGLEFRRVKK